MTHFENGYRRVFAVAGFGKMAMDPAIAKITAGLDKVDAQKAKGVKKKKIQAGKPVSQPKRTYSAGDLAGAGLK